MRIFRPRSLAALSAAPLVVLLSGCSGADPEPAPVVVESATDDSGDVTAVLGEVLTFHASFDNGVDADWALGDRQIYTAPSYDEQDQATPGIGNPAVDVADGAGRFGHALRFSEPNRHAIFYRAEDNVSYSVDNWSGTVSFWLSLDPATDLAPGFTDPIQITDQAYNDAAVWVDFTAENPRQFRLGGIRGPGRVEPRWSRAGRTGFPGAAGDRRRATVCDRAMDTRGHHLRRPQHSVRRHGEPVS